MRLFRYLVKISIPAMVWLGSVSLVWADTAKIPAAGATTQPAHRTTPAKTAVPSKAKKLSPVEQEAATLRHWRDVLAQELQKYWDVFKKQEQPRAYYMKYVMQRSRQVTISGMEGVIAILTDQRKKPKHQVLVKIRVGNHELDSSGREGYDWKAFRNFLDIYRQLPAELTLASLRKFLWQKTDIAIRRQKASYHRKRYVRSMKVEIKDKSGDFSKETPVVLEQMPPVLDFDVKKWKKIIRSVSSFSLKNLRVFRSSVSVGASQDIRILVDNLGSRIIRHKTLYQYSISIDYLAPKTNEVLSNFRIGYVDQESKLPDEKTLHRLVKKTLQELVDQGNAPEGEPVEAPAILLPDVAGVLFHEALGHRLEAQRMLEESDGRTFRRKIGQKVIPSFLSVLDDPTVEYWRGTPLNGHYLVDEEGVRTSRVSLIQDGVLRGFLLSRKPIDHFKHSNGHGRALFGRDPFSRMGNLLIQSKKEFSLPVLRKKLIEEAKRQGKPYAFIIARASGGYTHTGSYGIQSFKNQPKIVLRIDVKTGKEQLVKGLEIIGTPLTVVNNIIATGNDYGVFNGYCGAESGWVPVSAIAPSVLLQTVELQRIQINQRKFYMLEPPAEIASPKKAVPATPSKTSATKPKVRPTAKSGLLNK